MSADEPITFYREHDGSLSVESAVYQALGAASVCWEDMSGTGIFNDRRAKAIAEALMAKIRLGDEGPTDAEERRDASATLDRLMREQRRGDR